ncbi:MAG: LLM class flavin-dependent oxidoreductase [Hyphomicrobiaceae bacterium]
MSRELHLNLFIQGRGHHEAAWRHPRAAQYPLTDIAYFQDIAQRAEKACFDSIFLADQLTVPDDVAKAGRIWLEPVMILPALAVSTQRIGLIATASSTHFEPFNLARHFATIDHMSNGRAAWNIVTSYATAASANFNDKGQISHQERYEIADEFVTVCKALWDSWADGAVIDNRETGQYAHADRIRRIDHHGRYFNVAGPLNVPRSPQGRPVLVQAGSSDTGRGFAARHAEAVFTAHMEKVTAKAFYADLKQRAVAAGRKEDQVLILPGLSPMIGSTEAEARRLYLELGALADVDVGLKRLTARFMGHDFSHLSLDQPLQVEDFPDPATIEGGRSRTEVIIGVVRREHPTMRQLLARLASARGHFTMAGTPEQVADVIQDWYEDGAADGFNIMPPVLPWMQDVFAAEVIPILQKRGLFRTAYKGTTLREHYGLERPDGGW